MKKGDVGMVKRLSKKYGNKGWASTTCNSMSRCLSAPDADRHLDSPCYSAVSALLTNPLPDHSNYSPLCHTHYLTQDQYFTCSSGQTLYQAVSWRLILQSSMLQRFTAESSRECSALRNLNNKQRQVSMFLILLFKLLTQFPFVSFLSISILSLLPVSILSLLPLPHPFFLFWSILCLPKIKTSNFITFCFTNGLFHTMY